MKIFNRYDGLRRGLMRICMVFIAPFIMLATDGTADAQSKVHVESNQTYNGGSLLNSIANGNGFLSGMTFGGYFTAGDNLTDNQLADTDYGDPEIIGWPNNDTLYFDRADSLISYFTGHGICNSGSGVACSHTSQCTAQPGGVCVNEPNHPYLPGVCHYPADRSLVVNSTRNTWGPGQDVAVTYSNGLVKWGESTTHGNWAGAGTNGGINLGVLDISCGAYFSSAMHDLYPLFAGVHLVATIAPVDGDTANVPNRGSTFAANYTANPNGSVTNAWLYVMPQLGPHSPSDCACPGSGGGGGVNGCGLNLVYSADTAPNVTYWRLTSENWYHLHDNAYDAAGNGWGQFAYICNYDCAQACPIVLN
jgi:hypothetical protein